MSPPANALERLQSVAPAFGATLSDLGASAQVAITVTLTSGQQHVFQLELIFTGDAVSARETPVGSMLPPFCPDRHINSDGSFCLGWGAGDPSNIVDIEAARLWWSTLVRYLAHQVSATKLRRWPGRENDRAHGSAAKDQAIAEEAASRLGPGFFQDLRDDLFKVLSDGRIGNARLELWRAGKRVARVSLRSEQLVSKRIPCPCDAPTPLGISGCANHATDVATFILALYRWRKSERTFTRELAANGMKCCGTLAKCGLRTASAALTFAPKESERLNERKPRQRRRSARRKRSS